MSNWNKSLKVLLVLVCISTLSACAYGPYGPAAGPYYRVSEQPAPQDTGHLSLSPDDRYYVMQIEDRTPFGLRHLPRTYDVLYNKGYDRTRKEKSADFAIDIVFAAESRDNPDVRAGNTIGGALLGAATGALIGAAVGDPGPGAAIGAASGAALGLVAPANTPYVRIDLNISSYHERSSLHRSVIVDLANVPPHDVQRVLDTQVARMLQNLPRR